MSKDTSGQFALITDKYLQDAKFLGYGVEGIRKYLDVTEKEQYIRTLKDTKSPLLSSQIATCATIKLYENKPDLSLNSLRQFYDNIGSFVESLVSNYSI